MLPEQVFANQFETLFYGSHLKNTCANTHECKDMHNKKLHRGLFVYISQIKG